MYKIKYGKNKAGAVLHVLVFVLFFAVGGVTALFAERMSGDFFIPKEEKEDTLIKSVDEPIADEVPPVNDRREVWISGIEIGSYINEGDVIDVRIIKNDGRDEKLLAEKCITAIDDEGLFLVVREDELSKITDAFMSMADGTVLRAYAVRIP
ncbi:MAG: hypothetical protein K6F63_01930 [Lachnospiraceae bacterium]|nr:hypothetical protein [Lachnospiraceae bacterium]